MSRRYSHQRLRNDIEAGIQLGVPRPGAEAELLFRNVLEALRSGTLSRDQIQHIESLVGRTFYTDNNRVRHVRALDFIKQVIDALGAEERADEVERNGPIFREFFATYFHTIFIHVSNHDILTEAVDHAGKYVEPTHLFSSNALDSFELYWFCRYSTEGWSNEIVKHLLSIASAKVRHRCPGRLDVMGFNVFLRGVCAREDNSCEITDRLCDVVGNIYYMLKDSDDPALYVHLSQAQLFRKILRHVSSTQQTNCWLAVSKFIKMLFTCKDPETVRILTIGGVYPVMAKMFRRCEAGIRTPIIEELLLAVQAAGEYYEPNVALDPHWKTTLIPCVLRYTGGRSPFLRRKAVSAYEAISRVARPQDLMGQAVDVLTALLGSPVNSVVCNALKWMFELVEKIEAREAHHLSYVTMKMTIAETATRSFEALAVSQDQYIQEAARIVFNRLVSQMDTTPQGETARDRDRIFLMMYLGFI